MKLFTITSIFICSVVQLSAQIKTPDIAGELELNSNGENYTIPYVYSFNITGDEEGLKVKIEFSGILTEVTNDIRKILDSSIEDKCELTFDFLDTSINPNYPELMLKATVRIKVWLCGLIETKLAQDTGTISIPIVITNYDSEIKISAINDKIRYSKFSTITRLKLEDMLQSFQLVSIKLPNNIVDSGLKLKNARFQNIRGQIGFKLEGNYSIRDWSDFEHIIKILAESK